MSLFANISNPTLKQAYAYVLSTRRGRMMASRSTIDPVEMAPWLEHTKLLDVIDEGRTFRYRICSRPIERIFHRSMHRRYLDEIFSGEVLKRKLCMYRRTVENHVAILSDDSLECKSTIFTKYERILIPLSENGRDVDMILGCIYPTFAGREDINYDNKEFDIVTEEHIEDFSDKERE